MTRPDDDRTVEQPVVETPSVSTAPPPSRPHRWWSSIPSHLGRARTSTVVMSVLFLAIFALYLNVRPETVDPATTGGGGRTTSPSPTTSAPPSTTAPETTAPAPTTSEEMPETSEPLPTTSEPSVGTTDRFPEPTSDEEPTSTVGPSPPAEPTTISPPG